MLFIASMLPMLGVIMAIVPYLMKKGEVFAVTVPEANGDDPFLKSLKRRYVVIMALVTLMLSATAVAVVMLSSEIAAIVVTVIGMILICIISFALMLFYRSKVGVYKAEHNWQVIHQEATAVIDGSEVPKAISLKWSLLYLPIFAITFLIGYFGSDAMPDQIPMHWGIDGEVDNWVDKSPFTIWIPVLIQLFLAATLIVSAWAITRSKRTSDPTAPATSAYAYGMFARAWSIYLLVCGIILTAVIIVMPLLFIGILNGLQSLVFILTATIVIVLGSVALSVIYGQGGSRVFKRIQSADTMLVDDDKFWKLGVFYFNPDDPNWFLPARFSVGWTCNFARPIVWVFIVGLALITAVFFTALLYMGM
jgi:uncharacterized membrane protein